MTAAGWTRSSRCAGGDCLEAVRAGRVVLVQDSKTPALTGGPLQAWSLDEWQGLLDVARRTGPAACGVSSAYFNHTAIDVIDVEHLRLGLHRHELLTLTFAEWNTFVAGVQAGEFNIENLSSPPPATGGFDGGGLEVGSAGDSGSGEVATGAGAPKGGASTPVAAGEVATGAAGRTAQAPAPVAAVPHCGAVNPADEAMRCDRAPHSHGRRRGTNHRAFVAGTPHQWPDTSDEDVPVAAGLNVAYFPADQPVDALHPDASATGCANTLVGQPGTLNVPAGRLADTPVSAGPPQVVDQPGPEEISDEAVEAFVTAYLGALVGNAPAEDFQGQIRAGLRAAAPFLNLEQPPAEVVDGWKEVLAPIVDRLAWGSGPLVVPETVDCQARRLERGDDEACGASGFAVVYRSSRPPHKVLDIVPGCFVHAHAELQRAVAAGTIAQVDVERVPHTVRTADVVAQVDVERIQDVPAPAPRCERAS